METFSREDSMNPTPAGRRATIAALFLFVSTLILSAQQQRPPAVPLITHDPYFSIWSAADHLTDKDTTHWTGHRQPIHGVARIDGKPYRFMGAEPRDLPAMEQLSLKVTPTHTIYEFQAAGVQLTVTFFTPAFPNDLDVLSRPVTYLTLTARAESSHEVSVLIDVDPMIAVNTEDEAVTWGRSQVRSGSGLMTVLSVGSRDQRELNRPGDDVRIDWGYFHLASPPGQVAFAATTNDAIRKFAESGELAAVDELDMPKTPRNGAAHLAIAFPLSAVTAPTSRLLMLSYTEQFNIEYLNRKLRPYWQRNGETVEDMLGKAGHEFKELDERGTKFDQDLTADLEKAGGPAYTQLAILAYRQTLAAHGLAADVDGTPMLFPKENFSNGCISTVDVLYPSAPFFLFFNPALLQAQLKPVLEYAALPRWKWPFAPHDLGTYPLANGQVYGGGERTEEDQMPVEESGNLLILVAAMEQELGNWDFARQYWPQFTKWAEYLREKGLDPTNQLSTDDFAGHLAHNANLSIKAIEGLAAYAEMARNLNHADIAADYTRLAHDMVSKWAIAASDGPGEASGLPVGVADHFKLAFDSPGTWSQKYNLVWDQILGFKLFPAGIRQTEIAFYLKHLNQYGLPLDNRKDYTKLDWEIWTATLADNPADWNVLVAPIGRWINQGPTRVPLTDWYDTKTGAQEGFQARSVVGGVYIKALADKALAEKWRNRQEP
jgi:hypothetical protein